MSEQYSTTSPAVTPPTSAPNADCPHCNGSGSYGRWSQSPACARAYACDECDGTGRKRCAWCFHGRADVVVRDASNRVSVICPECWEFAETDPESCDHPVRIDGGGDAPALPWWQVFAGATTRCPNTGDLMVWRTNAAPNGYYPAPDPGAIGQPHRPARQTAEVAA